MATAVNYVCQTKCYFRDRIWEVGETIQPTLNEKLPVHFVDKEGFTQDKKKVPTDARSLAQFKREEAEAARRAVGHKPASAGDEAFK